MSTRVPWRASCRTIGVALMALALGCASRVPAVSAPAGGFRFPADTFAFANQTVWEYDVVPETGSISWRRREPRADFVLRCGTMARAVRQFWANATFDASAPGADGDTYARLVRAVLDSDRRAPEARRIVIPGYADLRSFSAAHEALVKAALAGAWQSHLQRGNWRMIFPFTARHQERLAAHLEATLAAGWLPIVHVLRYPRVTLNHFVLVFAVERTPTEVRFRAYDPNDAERPVVVTYDRAARTFSYAATPYFPGGGVKVYEVYDGLLG